MGASRLKVAQLPEDLILEILYRLPVKSLVRFKSVCKTWNQFLKSGSFISMHHKFNSGRLKSQLLMCSPHGVSSFFSNDKLSTVLSPDLRILIAYRSTYLRLAANSCNGIECYFDLHSAAIFLSNPATREFRQLPPSSFPQDEQNFIRQDGVAFGYDSADIYDFKVFRLLCEPHTDKALRAEIFTLSSNTWKQLHWGLDYNHMIYPLHGFFFAYSFHFIVDLPRLKRQQTIVCCDTHSEKFTTMDLPSTGKLEDRFEPELMVFKEFLSTLACDYRGGPLNIWIMKDYGAVESWTILHSIQPPSNLCRLLVVWTVEDALLIELEGGKLLSWDLNTQTFDSIEIQGYELASRFLVHQETLVSIM